VLTSSYWLLLITSGDFWQHVLLCQPWPVLSSRHGDRLEAMGHCTNESANLSEPGKQTMVPYFHDQKFLLAFMTRKNSPGIISIYAASNGA